MNIQEKACKHIKEMTGVDVSPCNNFTSVESHKGKKYINILLGEHSWHGNKYDIIARNFAIEPNGHKRIAFYI